jgi:hypothetical protein
MARYKRVSRITGEEISSGGEKAGTGGSIPAGVSPFQGGNVTGKDSEVTDMSEANSTVIESSDSNKAKTSTSTATVVSETRTSYGQKGNAITSGVRKKRVIIKKKGKGVPIAPGGSSFQGGSVTDMSEGTRKSTSKENAGIANLVEPGSESGNNLVAGKANPVEPGSESGNNMLLATQNSEGDEVEMAGSSGSFEYGSFITKEGIAALVEFRSSQTKETREAENDGGTFGPLFIQNVDTSTLLQEVKGDESGSFLSFEEDDMSNMGGGAEEDYAYSGDEIDHNDETDNERLSGEDDRSSNSQGSKGSSRNADNVRPVIKHCPSPSKNSVSVIAKHYDVIEVKSAVPALHMCTNFTTPHEFKANFRSLNETVVKGLMSQRENASVTDQPIDILVMSRDGDGLKSFCVEGGTHSFMKKLNIDGETPKEYLLKFIKKVMCPSKYDLTTQKGRSDFSRDILKTDTDRSKDEIKKDVQASCSIAFNVINGQHRLFAYDKMEGEIASFWNNEVTVRFYLAKEDVVFSATHIRAFRFLSFDLGGKLRKGQKVTYKDIVRMAIQSLDKSDLVEWNDTNYYSVENRKFSSQSHVLVKYTFILNIAVCLHWYS